MLIILYRRLTSIARLTEWPQETEINITLKVGARGFEPPTSASRTLRANQTAPRPVVDIIPLDSKLSNKPFLNCPLSTAILNES
jgi:hypothetical protein